MGNITCTAADVRPLRGAVIRHFVADAAIDMGAAVYMKSDGEVAESNAGAIGTTLATIGIAVATPSGSTAAAAGESVDVVVDGPVTGYSSMTPGGLCYTSDTAGSIGTTAGTKDTIVGLSLSATTILVRVETIDLT